MLYLINFVRREAPTEEEFLKIQKSINDNSVRFTRLWQTTWIAESSLPAIRLGELLQPHFTDAKDRLIVVAITSNNPPNPAAILGPTSGVLEFEFESLHYIEIPRHPPDE